MAMLETSSEVILESCPRCDYSLQGMPIECHCPECGLMLNRRWQVIAPRRMSSRARWMWTAWLVICAVFIYAFAIGPLYALARQNRWGFLVFGSILSLFLLFCTLAWIILLSRRPGFLALSPDGLVVFRGREPWELHPWKRIRNVRMNLWRFQLVLELSSEIVRLPGRLFFRGDPGEFQACVDTINAFRQQREC